MKFKLISNRMLTSDNKFAGYNNENRAELLEFEFPENLKDYTKTINFQTTEGNFFDILDGDTYTLKNNITKYDKVFFYIEFKKQISETEYEVIKTEIKTLNFNSSFNVDKEISEEEINILDSLIIKIDEATKRANAISQDLEEKVATDYYRGSQGEQGIQGEVGPQGPQGDIGPQGPQGESYNITSKDYTSIAGIVEENIKPTLDNNLKSAKDYTDNAIIKDFKDISYNQDTATFVFTRHDNTTFTVDLPIEQTVKNGYYDETTKELVLVLVSDQEIRIPASGLIDDYTGVDSATIQLTISADNKITANIKGGSITKTLLTTELQEEIDNKVNKSAFVYDETTETLTITI